MAINSSLSHLDPAALSALSAAVGKEHLIEVLDRILATTTASRAALESSFCEGNTAELARLAHTLRTECSYVGAAALAQRLEKIEADMQQSGPSDVYQQMPAILVALDGFLANVRSHREDLGLGRRE